MVIQTTNVWPKSMLFCSNTINRIHRLDENKNSSISIDGKQVEMVNSMKILGVKFNLD
jgi:hypothetical protein